MSAGWSPTGTLVIPGKSTRVRFRTRGERRGERGKGREGREGRTERRERFVNMMSDPMNDTNLENKILYDIINST